MARHRWGDKIDFPLAHKSERTCLQCAVVKVSRYENEGGHDRYWTEFWRGGERIDEDGRYGRTTPACEPVEETAP